MKESTALEPTVAEQVQRVREGEESRMTSIFLAWGVRWLMVPFIEAEIDLRRRKTGNNLWETKIENGLGKYSSTAEKEGLSRKLVIGQTHGQEQDRWGGSAMQSSISGLFSFGVRYAEVGERTPTELRQTW